MSVLTLIGKSSCSLEGLSLCPGGVCIPDDVAAFASCVTIGAIVAAAML